MEVNYIPLMPGLKKGEKTKHDKIKLMTHIQYIEEC